MVPIYRLKNSGVRIPVRIFSIAIALSGTVLLGACASTDDKNSPVFDAPSSSDESGIQGRELRNRPDLSAEPADLSDLRDGIEPADAFDALATVVYFEFDSAQLNPQALQIIEEHARRLRGQADARLRLEGHTDERGTREYNIALGERRAESVRRALLLRGASRAQVSVVSYGEESPAAYGSTEQAWVKNRRVEFRYLR
nr:peptidoglycan-associated lipoprotein Pal [Oceanococcus sp. HetDA_MAG_MS8]